VEDSKGSILAKGVTLSVAYCIAYLALRYISFNQWFLPAGLRAACLLFLPYRYWPFVFLGDAAGLLYLRVPQAVEYSPQWAYLSPILLVQLVSLVPHFVRKKLKTLDSTTRWIPLIALLIALWSSTCNMGLNYFLHGPRPLVTFENFSRYIIGDFLGIMMITLPILLWLRRGLDVFSRWKAIRDTLIAIAITGSIFLALAMRPDIDASLRQWLLMLMITPTVFLTFLHGWRGAAIGVIIVNLGIAQTLEYADVPGAHDATVFFAQQGLALAAITFLLLGNRITSHYERARQSGIVEREAIKLARASLLSMEPILRDQLLCMAQLQVLIDDERDQLAKTMRANGRHREALNLNSQGVFNRQIFDEQALALYPIGIEQGGLFAVIDSQTFMDSRATGVKVVMRFDHGDPRTLSVDLQVQAYRCLCHAIDLLSDWEPAEHRIRVRVWHGKGNRGVFVSVATVPTASLHATQAGETASLLLNARVRAHGGIVRRAPHHVKVLLSETNAIPSALQEMTVLG
jgi:MASE1